MAWPEGVEYSMASERAVDCGMAHFCRYVPWATKGRGLRRSIFNRSLSDKAASRTTVSRMAMRLFQAT